MLLACMLGWAVVGFLMMYWFAVRFTAEEVVARLGETGSTLLLLSAGPAVWAIMIHEWWRRR